MSTAITFTGHDGSVEAQPGETLLRAGLRAGLPLPYECASGGCGSCRAQLVEGTVTTLWEDATGLSERDRRRGNRVLMCQSVPDGPCTLKAPRVSIPEGVDEPTPQRYAARLAGRQLLTTDTALFTIAFDGPLRFLPGQFVLLESPEGVRRAYSMAHPVRDAGAATVEFVIRAKPGGAASQWLFGDISLGESLVAEGPYGRAYAQPHSGRPVLCIAGGTGLAPILAITEHLLTASRPPSLHLYVGARTDTDIVLLERLARLHDMGAELAVSVENPTFSAAALSPGNFPFSPVRVGRVVDHVADDWPALEGHDIYLAGPAGMVDAAMRALVRGAAAPADRVFFDRFIA
ncbi:2Fe-2S iron-sulfur cluster binding domain-containing protein [Mycobacterium sp. RTGN8]|uniref:2Fe-2S iron-sulfur cluster binding domain-containing protein n=1 Tax=Mycobacterium sp. RTGN8 TaxID=3016520 RepID=UPI0029C708DB|nr:2Fe-2S iron-sulfur cluster binding domain-containing protein [Mycobacterium sp. RTGN8]